MLITCPSGLSFQARRWRIGDRRNMHDQRIVKQGMLMRKMLEAVDEGVECAGPYPFEIGKPVNWSKVSITDIIDALIEIRVSTKPKMEYAETCENCGRRIPIEIDLSKLEKIEMSDKGKEHLTSTSPVPYTIALQDTSDLAEGEEATTVEVKLRVLLGADIPVITQHQRQNPKVMQEIQMVMHISELTTPDGKKLTKFKDIQDFYAMQDWFFQEGLDEKIAELGGGMVTTVEMSCLSCNAEQEGSLPFGVEFFYPKPKKRNISSMASL